MKCPVCKEVNLSMAERRGIEIDYCPQCRGIWLDRGELDRMLAQAEREPEPVPDLGRGERREHPAARGHRDPKHGHYQPRRKSFLRELLEFD